jgi:hypothetical protein
MVAADTSVWIDFLKQQLPRRERMISLIENREILMLECITAELLQGAKSKKDQDIIISYWELLPKVPMETLFLKAGILSSKKQLISKGIGLIDTVIMTACYETEAKLWTLDKKILKNLEKKYIYNPAS